MADAVNDSVQINTRSVIVVLSVTAFYLILSALLVGFKSDQLVLAGIFNAAFFLSPVSRKFILGFSIFIVYWIIFDYMKAFPNYNYSTVHIEDLYNAEKHIFGIHFNGSILTPNEYWRANSKTAIDVAAGIFYLCWIPVPLAFAAYLFFKNRRQFLYFSLTFVLINLLGFIVYYVYPAAPPWYVQFNGFTFHAKTPGNTAGLARFDAFFNAGIFKSIYAKGSNVFAAMPSLHSSYPVVVLYYGLKNRLKWMNIFFVIVMLGIWFTAIYASHHYVLDVLAGILTAFIGINLFNLLIKRSKGFKNFIDRFEAIIR
ncbi:phosphatase PAP2 family protein [Mucilaginibacter sp. L3T2-6]|uniref:phosphatase PAP2 family protein n=1 Tax=Mucilaginibacter sp. L3T2-6 TaxID=3062491 RepID=UPI002676C1B1|nr:phosphatase PAP2 family protein [Mucilaginibacter sp. L3T2-6]MDO3641083.1 phosphatase PAP2 family protein [Mucilaginibacter sp. L3T2-6]MDV6213441.1 phosphatase PAP2 family protein [Mucilaginibacter sp. L3T2-6]